ncbi:outer membrane protein [Aestuariivirga sp.]|uniref:outer membrane protein n=1 Tax=Aestuariivirga sp. TaxID=2650926 RepID=UPI0039E66C20
MKKHLLGFTLAAAAILAAAPALAADIDAPAPVELRGSDWSGVYAGVFGTAISVDGNYDGVCSCAATYDKIEHSGIGYGGGLMMGANYQMDSAVLGIEGDWAWGGEVASNDEPTIDTNLKFKYISTLRARAGWLADDNTLIYVTGGAAAVNAEFNAVMASKESDSGWTYGWTAGAGIEHAFSPNFHGRLEYLYVGLPNAKFSMTDSATTTLDAKQHFESVQMVRAGLTYNFVW